MVLETTQTLASEAARSFRSSFRLSLLLTFVSLDVTTQTQNRQLNKRGVSWRVLWVRRISPCVSDRRGMNRDVPI